MHRQQDNPEIGKAVLGFFDWAYRNGAEQAIELDYVPIPESVYAIVQRHWAKTVTGPDGAPLWNGGDTYASAQSVDDVRGRWSALGLFPVQRMETHLQQLTVPAAIARQLRWNAVADLLFRRLTLLFAIFVAVLVFAILVALLVGAWPALSRFGPGFITSAQWNPVTEEFGALATIFGTLLTSTIAMLI